jgi:type IV secretory pathway VirB4 component
VEELQDQVLQIVRTARRCSIEVEELKYRQREGLNSILSLGHNHVEISRDFTTEQAAIFVPFTTQEVNDKGGNYVGQNKVSNNLVFNDREKHASPMGFIAGKPGSGKSFAVKTEIQQTILNKPNDQIFIVDRAGEYTHLTRANGGVVLDFAVDSDTCLNVFDLSDVEHMTRKSQIAFKEAAILAQAAASASESGEGLPERDRSLIQRVVEIVYQQADRRGGTPILEDFWRTMKEQPEPEAQDIALRYERLVTGSMDFFNNQSNIDLSARVIDINLKDLPDSLLVPGLIFVCEAIRNKMYANFERGIKTWLYMEEAQSFFDYPTVLSYFQRFTAEGRKFNLIFTGITQNSVSMLENENAKNIVLNADYLLLLKQSSEDRRAWSNILGLSALEESYIGDGVKPGEGLMCSGAARVPIMGNFPKGNILYDIFNTDPNEIAALKRKQRAA